MQKKVNTKNQLMDESKVAVLLVLIVWLITDNKNIWSVLPYGKVSKFHF